MPKVSFRVDAVPCGQPRHRATRTGRMYLPADAPIHTFKAAVKAAWVNSGKQPFAQGVPVAVSLTAYFPRPKSKQYKKRPQLSEPVTSKPDCDNVAKAVLDALNSFAWHDDSQVCKLHVEKWLCEGTTTPRVLVEIYEIGDETA